MSFAKNIDIIKIVNKVNTDIEVNCLMEERKFLEKKLKELKPELKAKYNVKNIGIFGSYARQEANQESDIDILVEFSGNIGWEFIDLKNLLEKKLGKEVDLVTSEALKSEFKEEVLKEVIYQ